MIAETLALNGAEEFACNTCSNYEYLTYEEACSYAFLHSNRFEQAMAVSDRKQHGPEPKDWRDIKGRADADKWLQAAHEEVMGLLENGTFTIEQLPHGRTPIGCRWVFKLKRKPDGSIDRYKGRLVAKGFSQRPGIDFDQTFSPTAKWAALRAILAIVALEDLECVSVDISRAFLNGDMDHDVYMDYFQGFEELGFGKRTPGYALKLAKSIYGLKQAGRQWYKKLDSSLQSLGFARVKSDNSIWVYRKDDVRIIIPAYVDDMFIATKERGRAQQVIQDLEKHFQVHDLGDVSFLLGVHIQRDRSKRTLTLSQRQYIVDLLEHYSMSDCAAVSTPLDPNCKLSKEQCPQTDEDKASMRAYPYAQLVGSLMYLAIATRPDISYSVGLLGRFSSNPGLPHWKAAKHLLRYLKGTMDLKLEYAPDPSQTELFVTYCDADHGGDRDNKRSTSGMIVKMGTGAISWASRLQTIATLSTTEAEFVSAVSAGQEIVWLRNLLSELGYTFPGPSTLFVDNQSAIAVANNPEHHGRMKHLDLRFYWLRDVVELGLIQVKHLRTDSMPADLLTKQLGRLKVNGLRQLMGLQ